MSEAMAEITCVDYWPHGISRERLGAYKAMMDAGQITDQRAVMNKSTGSVLVQYRSTVPQEWIRQEMARIAEGVKE